MTLYFLDNQAAPAKTNVYVDGDYSGYETYRVQLISKYNNKNIEQDGNVWELEANLSTYNERYTYFTISSTDAQFVENTFRSGYYTFKLLGSAFDLAPGQPFVANQWDVLYTQECKIKTKTTSDMQRGEEAQTVKYTTEPNTAQSYVIYNQ
tara:strand:+ start:121 stop:573 length:453 start_codon:yes stop_codon:yes gene_type:complete